MKQVMKGVNEISFHVPANFSSYDLVSNLYKRADKRMNMADAMNYIVSLCIPDYLSKDRYEELQETGYVSLNAMVLKSILGTSYKEAINLAIQIGVIETNNRYITGQKSKGYRLTPTYVGNIVKVTVQSKGIKRRIQAHRNKISKEQLQRKSDLKHVLKWIDSSFISIDTQAAHYFIERGLYEKRKLIDSQLKNDKMIQNEAKLRLIYRIQHQIMSSKALVEGHLGSIVDSTGRLHTNITGMKRELRSFLRLNGNPLASVDVKAAQPYFFLALLNPAFWGVESPMSLYAINSALYRELEKKKILKDIVELSTRLSRSMEQI